MDETKDLVIQLEDELRVLKAQLQQTQAQLNLVNSQGKNEKERLQASLNCILDGSLYHTVRDAHTGALRFDYVSGTWEKITGVSAKETMSDSQKVFANFVPSDLKRLRQCIYDPIEPTAFEIELRYNHPVTKKQLWLQIVSNPFRAGDHIYSDGFIFDITAKKETEQNLDFELKRMIALNNMPDGTLYRTVRDRKTGILRFKHLYGKWEEILGVSVEKSLADINNVFRNIEPGDLKRLMQEIEESLNPLRSFEMAVRYHHPSKKGEYWILVSSHPRYEGDEIVADGFIFDVTARKIAEQKVKAEKERLETLGNHIPDGVLFRMEIDKHTKNMSLAYASGTWEKITGVPAAVAMADINSLFTKIHSDDLPVVMQEIDKCVKTLTTLLCEYRIAVNGRMRWLQMTSHPREEGEVFVADGIISDITRHKAAEAELTAEKNRLQTIGDNIPEGALFQFIRDVRTAQMRFTYTSATWSDVTGISADLATSDILNIFDALHSADLPVLINSIEESARSMSIITMEMRAKGDCWLHIVARPRREGTYIVWDGIIINIADRKKTEYDLENERIRLKNLGDNLPAGSLYQFVRDARTHQMRMSHVSASWEEVTGISAEDSLSSINNVFKNVHSDKLDIFIKAIDESERTMSDFIQELWMGDRWLQLISRPRREGEMIIWDGIAMNITAQKEAEAELTKYRENLEKLVHERTDELSSANEELFATNEELFATNEELASVNEELEVANEELKKYQTELEKMVEERTQELVLAKDKAEESDRLKSSFLANMSHEIRTPLNGIVGFLQFLDSDNLSPDIRHEYIDVIKNSSAQLSNIIEDIIDVSKIEAKLLNMNPVPILLNDLMREMRLFFEAFLRSKNKEHVGLILDDSGFIDNCLTCVDAVRLRQVITNLIGNSVKFTDKGYIRFGYRQTASDMLEFVVEDTGIGLPENQIDTIFDRFFQVEQGNNRIHGGTGLGLPISRSLVHLKGGDMWVKSTEGVGSAFYFTMAYLPVAPEDVHIFADSPAGKQMSDKPFSKKTILLAEPVPMKSIYYEKLISATGATVIKAANLEECSERLITQHDHFDMVIADGTLFSSEHPIQIGLMAKICANSPVALIVSEKKQITGQKLCHATIDLPVNYAKILKVLEDFAK